MEKNILIVEDNALIAEDTAHTVQDCLGLTPLVVSRFSQVLSKIEKNNVLGLLDIDVTLAVPREARAIRRGHQACKNPFGERARLMCAN